MSQAEAREIDHFADVAQVIRNKGYTCHVCPVQVGSKGYIDVTQS